MESLLLMNFSAEELRSINNTSSFVSQLNLSLICVPSGAMSVKRTMEKTFFGKR